MSLLFGCGLCCMLLSIWAILQLVKPVLYNPIIFRFYVLQISVPIAIAMGFFFKMEVLAFIEEAEPDHHAYDDFDDFMDQTKQNYQKAGVNCWIAAAMYVITLGLSYICIKKSEASARLAAEKIRDDEIFCTEKAKKL